MLAERVKNGLKNGLKKVKPLVRLKAKLEGKAELLIDLLERRFQPLNEEQQDLIFALKSKVIASAIEYLFQASSLDEIFEYINTLETVKIR